MFGSLWENILEQRAELQRREKTIKTLNAIIVAANKQLLEERQYNKELTDKLINKVLSL